MRRLGSALLSGIALLISGLPACSRGDVGVGITVRVIDQRTADNPFGPANANRVAGRGMLVYLVKDGVPLDSLSVVKAQWLADLTDGQGIAKFPKVRGVYHVLVDADHDGSVDAQVHQVPSGSSRTIVLDGRDIGDGQASALETTLDRNQYANGQRVRVTVTGHLASSAALQLEVWRDDEPERKKLLTLDAKTFSGDVTYEGSFSIGKNWPITKKSQLDDYLVVPKAAGRYYTGARFSLRPTVAAKPVGNLQLTINNGAPYTLVQGVTLTVSASNAARVAFSEDPARFPLGAPKFLFSNGQAFNYSLALPDGVKTVWAMFFDADDNYADPVSDTILLNTAPADITGFTFTINHGAALTQANAVTLTVGAGNAVRVAFSDNPNDFPNGKPKFPFSDGDDFDYQLKSPDGMKTLWAMFFGVTGNYAPPVSASILFDTSPTPVTGATLTINYGAPVTMYPVVLLQAKAFHADYVYFADDVTGLATAIPFSLADRDYGYALLSGNGAKTVWAVFSDRSQRAYSDPVSATIRLQEGYPEPPDPLLLYVIAKPPGEIDYVGGITGAAGPGVPISVYADRYEDHLLAQGFAAADGSFGPWGIGDGSVAGNVEKPNDYVFVVITDSFGRASAPGPVTNDSTAPDPRPEDINGYWTYDPLGNNVGNSGDEFRGYYAIPTDYFPVADAVGGFADFRNLGGPANVSASTTSPGLITADFTIPLSANVDRDYTHFSMRLYDAAGNLSDWVTTHVDFFVDTIPPRAITIEDHEGGNRKASVTWYDPNYDSQGGYVATFTDETGAVLVLNVPLLQFCLATNFSGLACLWYASYYFGGVLPDGVGGPPVPFWFEPLDNCHWYAVSIQAVDNGGNIGPYSAAVSDRVILPPPAFQAWGSFSIGGASGSLIYAANAVTNAYNYELHFGLTSGSPYQHTTSSGQTSPLGFTIPVSPYVARLSGLPLRSNVYLSARAIDVTTPTCKSDYAPEMTVATDLRLQSTQDGTGGETIGGALAAITDVTGDNLIDLLTVATLADYVVTINTSTGVRENTFGTFRGAVAYDFPGNPLAAADVDGDGAEDYIVGSPADTYAGKLLAGSVRIYAHDHTLMSTLGMAVTGLQFGFAVAGLGDIDGQPGDEFAVGGFGCAHRECSFNHYTGLASEGPGRVQVYTYKFGAFVPLFPPMVGPLKGDYFGSAFAGGYNVITASTENDFAIGIPGSPYIPSMGVVIIDGASGQPAAYIEPKSSRFGSSLGFIRDLDGDGIADLIVGSPGRYGYGEVWAISSRDWNTVLWQQNGQLTYSGSGFASVIATGGDVNHDGQDDVIVGAPPTIQAYYYGYGSAYVLDGKTGRFLSELRAASTDGAIGYSVLLPGNVNAGPADEWVIGAPGTAQSAYQAGRIYILSTDP